MTLEQALKGLFDAERALQTKEAIGNPVILSNQMMRLSQYAGAVEIHLAEYEKTYEETCGKLLGQFLIKEKLKVTQAERMVDIEVAEIKGQLKYLSRIVKSAWEQCKIVQSRINHLITESQTQV